MKNLEQSRKMYHKQYIEGNTEISDIAYDALEKKGNLPPAFQDISDLDNKNEHAFPMLSLEKAYVPKDIHLFFDRVCPRGPCQFVMEPKIDGIGMSCRYENGLLKTVTTRGNGTVGENITKKLKDLVPGQITGVGDCEVRGELFINNTKFEQLQKQTNSYQNSRHAIAGWANRTDGKQWVEKYGSCRFFDMLTQNDVLSTEETLQKLEAMGFPIIEYCVVNLGDGAELYDHAIAYYNQWLYFGGSLPFDGIVIKVGAAQKKQALGTTSSYPKWAIALKSNDPGTETVVERIVYQIGRTGVITPVAEIQPITIKGSVISRVTLHNIDYLQTMDIRPKDTVFVIKAGQVIPQILEVLTDQRPIDSQPVDIQESLKSQNINAQLVDNKWVGTDLQALRIRRLVYYAKKLRIALLGPALITQLVHEGIVNEVIDLYNIQEKTLCANTYVGPKKAKQVVQNIQSTRQCQFKDWLVACGIPKIGPQTANLIAQNVYCFSDFQNLPTQKIKLTAQIGPTLAKSFCEWMSANPSFLEAFASFEFQFTPRASLVHKTLPLFGSVFVFTGKFNKITRAVATEQLTQLGGTVQSQINKKTHYIILGEKPSKGKIEKAQNLTCKFFPEDDFITFLNAYEINSIT